MNAIFSIHKKFSDLIFDGTKPWEFRNIRTKLEAGDKVYIYETKSGGCGKVVGYFVVDYIKEVSKSSKLGCYHFLVEYAERYLQKEDVEQAKKATGIDMSESGYNPALVLMYLYFDEELDYVKENKKPPSSSRRFEDMVEYDRKKKKAIELTEGCDEWLNQMGFYNKWDESTWKYQIRIREAVRFAEPVSITEFKRMDGTCIGRAPQSFCYCVDFEQ